jgi:hypothetical protein
MEYGSEFELIELLDIQNDSMKEIMSGRWHLGLIMPKLKAVISKTRIQIHRNPPPFF